jgi:hypothetical protein
MASWSASRNVTAIHPRSCNTELVLRLAFLADVSAALTVFLPARVIPYSGEVQQPIPAGHPGQTDVYSVHLSFSVVSFMPQLQLSMSLSSDGLANLKQVRPYQTH